VVAATVDFTDPNGNEQNEVNFTQPPAGTQGTPTTSAGSNSVQPLAFNCGTGSGLISHVLGTTGTVEGCVAEVSYLFFGISSWIADGAARFLDFFVYYSTNSASYTNDFVTKAFGALRDIANIFFIIALLYVAIKTILDIGVTSSKKMIGPIVIIALLINFSLFFTQVVIDGTNILAKVFYNQMSAVDENNKPLPPGNNGQTSISVGLVSDVNPQKILNAGVGAAGQQTYYLANPGQFIFMTLLAMFILLYMAYVFFMVALLFVGRVVALWLAMIFAPLAFASYTISPNIPGIGFNEWWDSLWKNAFMAPFFIFFLYVIVMFAGFLTTIVTYTPSDDAMQKIMAVVIPFAILMILLMQAKGIATKLSGKIGEAITGLVKTVGGFVGGAALGATAMVGTGVIGGISSKIASNEGLQKAALEKKGLGGFAARMAMKTTTAGSKATFDVRKTALGGAMSKGMGMNFGAASAIGLGSKEGGFKGSTERAAKKIVEESETYKTKLTNEQIVNGVGNGGKDYLDKNGNKITTAAALDTHKQELFKDKIGKNDLLSAIGYSTAKKVNDVKGGAIEKEAGDTYEKDHNHAQEKEAFLANKDKEYGNNKPSIAQNIADEAEFEKNYKKKKEEFVAKTTEEKLDKQAQTTKMVIGGVAGVALGAATGGGALFGGMGALYGGGATGAVVGGLAAADIGLVQQNKTEESERIARASLAKLGGVAKRLDELTILLKNQKEVFGSGKKDFPHLYGTDGKINKAELSKEIANKGIDENIFKEKMSVLIKTIQDKKNRGEDVKNDEIELARLRGQGIENILKTQTLKSLEGIEERINNTETQIFTVKGSPGSTNPAQNKPTPPTVK
jgi:hypothetical protein